MGPDSGRVAPYGELIELAEREHELIANRDYEGLKEILAARKALMADLPEIAAKDALHAIRRLMDLQQRNDAALEQASGGIAVELRRLRSGRAGVRRYAPAAQAGQRVSESA
jgi:hypothetical protein